MFDFSNNLAQLLNRIQSDYEGRNVSGVILVSDGIYNQGISPVYTPFNFVVHSVGLGDTIPKTDINLRTLLYNKLSYQGNKFPLRAEVLHNGFAGLKIQIEVLKGNEILASQQIVLKGDNEISEVDFLLEAEGSGLQHLLVRVNPLSGEYSNSNNVKHAYIDVIEGKEKIALVAHAPHPDIKAIRSALEKNKNYELHLFIPGIREFDDQKYDLIIFHQIPDKFLQHQAVRERIMKGDPSVWFIMGSQTNLEQINRVNAMVNISSRGNQKDNVTAVLSPEFNRFNLDPELKEIIREYPPLTVPFGKYSLTQDSEVILFQKVGSIETNKPLLVLREKGEQKSAILIGEGIWKWRLQEFAQTEKHQAFDELTSKLVQYLSSKEDKRKFKVYPVKTDIYTNESALFETEIYNDIYEETYGHKVDLTIVDENGKKTEYTYTTSEFNTQYRVSGLPQGVYNFSASTILNNQNVSSSGEFTVNELLVETLDLTANHNLLRETVSQNGGRFFKYNQMDQLQEYLTAKTARGIIHSEEDFLPIINLHWILVLLLFLATLEWGLRKYSGGY